jgi:hypothetical protein
MCKSHAIPVILVTAVSVVALASWDSALLLANTITDIPVPASWRARALAVSSIEVALRCIAFMIAVSISKLFGKTFGTAPSIWLTITAIPEAPFGIALEVAEAISDHAREAIIIKLLHLFRKACSIGC